MHHLSVLLTVRKTPRRRKVASKQAAPVFRCRYRQRGEGSDETSGNNTAHLMDTNYKPVMFRDLLDGSFYFEEHSTDADVADDAFRKYNEPMTTRIEVRDKFLVLNMDGKLQGERKTIYESRQAECRFCIQYYDDSSSPNDPEYHPRVGLPVVLYTIRDNVKMVVSCNNERQICALKKDIEEEIKASRHMTVFYLRQLSGSNRFRLESSIFENKFLGFEDVSSSLSTVTLCDGGQDSDIFLSI